MKFRNGIYGLTLTSALALAVYSANAADIYAGGGGYKDGPAVASWTGFYVGVDGGGTWSQNTQNLSYLPTVFTGEAPYGGFGGGQIGYNWQSPWGFRNYLLGIEADIQGARIDGKDGDGTGNLFKSHIDYFGTIRGRLGYAEARDLYYLTGGFAYGGLKNEANIVGVGDFKSNTTATGYVFGAGIEHKFNAAWSFKGEWQYINLGKVDPTDPIAGSYSANGGLVRDNAFHNFILGLNYHFLASYEPLK